MKVIKSFDLFLESINVNPIEEGKKFYTRKDIIKFASNASDIVYDAKFDIQDLAVSYGDKVPAKELERVLANYDLELEDVLESAVTEAFASAKLRSILTDHNRNKYISRLKDQIAKAVYNKTGLQLDKIQDNDIVEMNPNGR